MDAFASEGVNTAPYKPAGTARLRIQVEDEKREAGFEDSRVVEEGTFAPYFHSGGERDLLEVSQELFQ